MTPQEFAVEVAELAKLSDPDAVQVMVALRVHDKVVADLRLRVIAARLGVEVSAEGR
jgi:hypothetical protein